MHRSRESLGLLRALALCLVCLGLLAFKSGGAEQESPKSQPAPKAAGQVDLTLADPPLEVLGGRFFVRTPKGAAIEGRAVPIMAAAESDEVETRIVLDRGELRLVLMVNDCFALASENFEADVKKCTAKWPDACRVEPLKLAAKGPSAVSVTPMRDPDHTRSVDATFVAGAFVMSADRSIQSFDLYTNAAGEKNLVALRSVFREIVLSVAPGKKTLNLEAGERRLFVYSKDTQVLMKVPGNTVLTRRNGPDFLVYNLTEMGSLGTPAGNMLIYAGGHPNYEPGEKRGAGVLFGKAIEWRALAEGKGLQTLCDFRLPDDPELKMHIIIEAPGEAGLNALKRTAESMKLVKSPAEPQAEPKR